MLRSARVCPSIWNVELLSRSMVIAIVPLEISDLIKKFVNSGKLILIGQLPGRIPVNSG